MDVGFAIYRYHEYYLFVSSGIKAVPKPRRPGTLEEEVFVALARTTDQLARRLEPVLKAAEISPTQYNVLRILRGAPEGLTCSEVGGRMISRDPDITRLMDRLEKRGLVSRYRDSKDRRMVLTRITQAGLSLLAQLGIDWRAITESLPSTTKINNARVLRSRTFWRRSPTRSSSFPPLTRPRSRW